MYVRPCRNCPHKKDCEIKAAKLAIVRPAGLSSINFRCAKRLSLLPPGQRIEFDMADSDLSSGDWDDYKYTFTGIVMKPRGSKILVWLVSVDDDEYDTPGPHPQEFTNILRSGKNPISLSPNRVRPVEGRVNVCSECGQPEGTKPAERKGMETFCCWKCQGWECCREDVKEGQRVALKCLRCGQQHTLTSPVPQLATCGYCGGLLHVQMEGGDDDKV